MESLRADVFADDLDEDIRAPREGASDSHRRRLMRLVLREIFNEARTRTSDVIAEEREVQRRARESNRTWVEPRLVEHPVADVLVTKEDDPRDGADADDSWFYIRLPEGADLVELSNHLYTQPRSSYSFRYQGLGSAGRLATFDVVASTFVLNDDHPLVMEYADHPSSERLLHDIVTAEAMLEVYLREHGVRAGVAGDILEQRDQLLRGLAAEGRHSLQAIALDLRDAAADEYDLEVALVAAARALGFVAKHVGNAGEPDGLARYGEFRGDEKLITLEAKSSKDIPKLDQIGFDALQEHMNAYDAEGCLLVAPGYPGQAEDPEHNACANRAREARVSCWTVEQLAQVVEHVERLQLGATTVLRIVTEQFAPVDVTRAVEGLLSGAPTPQSTFTRQSSRQ